jgi:dipeptidase D
MINFKVLCLSLLATFFTTIVNAGLEIQMVENRNINLHQKTREILDIFMAVNLIPRCSGQEKKISQWLRQWVKDNGFDMRIDNRGNVVIKIPPSEEYKHAPIIVIQGHMDMVCEKAPDAKHDFSRDPIRFIYDGEWLKADKTTLGADNGIAIAMGLALAKDRTIAHPPLELLFTVGEEKGLIGANALEPGFIKGKILLNLDSEDEGVFIIGCAGGKETTIRLPVSTKPFPENYKIYQLKTEGMRGGHSGVDIHKHRANAVKILARALHRVNNISKIRLISITGGTVGNAIPREAEALFRCDPKQVSTLKEIISGLEQTVRREYSNTEKKLSITLSELDSAVPHTSGFVQQDSDKAIQLLLSLPHGVAEMSADVAGLVETSNNLAIIRTKDKILQIVTSQRSSVMSKLEEISGQIEAVAALAGATIENTEPYSGWQPNVQSPLLKRCKEVYKKQFNKDPEVKAVHAGLETGVIGSRFPNLDMISLGPTIRNPHSPDEKLFIPSIEKVWDFLIALLKSYK